MADVSMYKDKEKWNAFVAKGKAAFERLREELAGQQGVVAIEPESGDYFVGATLGKANALAFQKYPDQWLYFVRLDNPDAAMPLPTW
ncbi:MAG: hypothetical protein ACP5UM_01270 [Anaerolineae bacterium]